MRARRKSATGEDLVKEFGHLKHGQSAYDEEDELESRLFATDVAPPPSISVDEYSFNLLSYLGVVDISEQSLEVSELWESEEHVPSILSHKSFPINDEKPKGNLFSIASSMGEEVRRTCFAEELSGEEESTSRDECLCQANLRGYHETIGTEASMTTSEDEDQSMSDVSDVLEEQRCKEDFTDENLAKQQDGKSSRFCDQFEPMDVIADKFVRWIIGSAEAAISWEAKQQEAEGGEEVQVEDAVTSMVTFTESFRFSWPTIKDFTRLVGSNTVREYISTWYYVENWIYDVKLVLEQSDECSDFFTYETKWGIPTKQYPIPQVTASIFFVIEVSRVKPINCPVDITYYYEGCSYVQAPHVNFFNESQLFSVVYAKLKFYKQLRF